MSTLAVAVLVAAVTCATAVTRALMPGYRAASKSLADLFGERIQQPPASTNTAPDIDTQTT
jgi:hypothetical protein